MEELKEFGKKEGSKLCRLYVLVFICLASLHYMKIALPLFDEFGKGLVSGLVLMVMLVVLGALVFIVHFGFTVRISKRLAITSLILSAVIITWLFWITVL